ncbi:MAG: DUF885 domain-containing protein [Gemmatimonadota bacterium]
MSSRLPFAVLTLGMLVTACAPAENGPAREPSPMVAPPSEEAVAAAREEFVELRDAFLPWYYEAHPVRATQLGIHTHDARLPALDRTAIQGRIDRLLEWLARLQEVPFPFLPDEERYDYAVLEFALQAALLELEETRSWVRDPRVYTSTIAAGASSIAQRAYAPESERQDALAARLAEAPGLLDAARQNLSSPPRLWTELAIDEAEALMEFLESGLPTMFAGGAAGSIGPEVEAARDRLVAALAEHRDWLESDLLPRSTGSYVLGRYLFERKLLYEEHIALSVEELSRLNEEAIAEYRAWFERVAAEIDPDRAPAEIMDSILAEHPTPEELLPAARNTMAQARDWVARVGVVPLPVSDLPTVREMPSYARRTSVHLDSPGPFESPELESFFYITSALPDWSEAEVQEYLASFNRSGLVSLTVHETFPGRYVQQAYEREASDLRRIFTAPSLVDGWAHYAEQMALDEGFSDDPGVRLAQLRRALQHHARWHAALELHALGGDLEAVVRRFMEIAHLPEFTARREVVRATYDPLYLAGALGRIQINELRDDYREHLEEEDEVFRLAAFHERLLSLGLPLPLAREVMIPLPERGTRAERGGGR